MAVQQHGRVVRPRSPMPELHAATHPSRTLLTRVMADPGDHTAWAELAATYDGMAGIWTRWAADEVDSRDYLAPVAEGLARVPRGLWCAEVSCGTGQATPLLTDHCDRVLATDVNQSMLEKAPRLDRVGWVQADVRRLPFADRSVPLLVGLNAVPCIEEFERVLAPDGLLLWCTSYGPGTPLYVEPERLVAAMADGWRAAVGLAAYGDWTLLRRTTAHVTG